jgi:hypothetical protein
MDAMPTSTTEPLAASGRLKLFRRLRWLLGIRREDIVGLYGTICRALPPDLAEQFKSLDTTDGIRVTLRTGETFWFRPNTMVKAIVAHIVEETSSRCCSALNASGLAGKYSQAASEDAASNVGS